MYDRRVVRGNTFAALVIPVSKSIYPFSLLYCELLTPMCTIDMQPDPMSVEKQKRAAAARRNRLQKMKVSPSLLLARVENYPKRSFCN